jgi:hypothetical protein
MVRYDVLIDERILKYKDRILSNENSRMEWTPRFKNNSNLMNQRRLLFGYITFPRASITRATSLIID